MTIRVRKRADDSKSFRLEEMLSVLRLPAKLFSIRRIARFGISMHSAENQSLEGYNRCLIQTERYGFFHAIHEPHEYKAGSAASAMQSLPADTWHARYGHLGAD